MCNNLVTIVIPNYNHSRFLRRRLESIFDQSYRNFEVILLDDCSTDDSVEIFYEYSSHPKVSHFIINHTNSGSPFKQWEKGIGLAKGEFIWLAESDDFSDHNFLSQLISLMEQEVDVSLAFCHSHWVDGDGSIIDDKQARERVVKVYDGRSFVSDHMLEGNKINNAGMAIFRKSAFQFEFEPEKWKLAGDWFFWINIALRGRVIEDTERMNFFRFHDQSVRSNSRTSGLFFFEGIKIFKFASALLDKTNWHSYKFWASQFLMTYRTIDKAKRKALIMVALQDKMLIYFIIRHLIITPFKNISQ